MSTPIKWISMCLMVLSSFTIPTTRAPISSTPEAKRPCRQEHGIRKVRPPSAVSSAYRPTGANEGISLEARAHISNPTPKLTRLVLTAHLDIGPFEIAREAFDVE